MFRDLIPELADRFHVVAPDLPGFGMTEHPARDRFAYTFENIATVIGSFTEALGLEKFAIYVFDYGAPVGFRLAVKNPERITAIVTQNGNTYLEGRRKLLLRCKLTGTSRLRPTAMRYAASSRRRPGCSSKIGAAMREFFGKHIA